MANYSWTRIHFLKKDKKKLMDRVKSASRSFDFEKIIPLPREYTWSLGWKLWGTRSQACETEWTDEHVTFTTAWNPPFNVLKKLFDNNFMPVYIECCEEHRTYQSSEYLYRKDMQPIIRENIRNKLDNARIYNSVRDYEFEDNHHYESNEGEIFYCDDDDLKKEYEEDYNITLKPLNFQKYRKRSYLREKWEEFKEQEGK